MGIPRTIQIKEGKNGKKTYYYWDEYDSYDEALYYCKKLKKGRMKDMKIKYFILETQDSWFLPVTKYVAYINKKLRLV